MYKKVSLRKKDSHQICWVDTEKNFKVGDSVELKGVEGLWKVEQVYQTELEKNAIRTDWKVGGIKEVAR